jgi:hypothetical protein
LAGFTFQWDITRALELACATRFACISGLLHTTGDFEKRPRKRYDDTAMMVAELPSHGPDRHIGFAVSAA